MLPRFAATVCRTTMRIRCFCRPDIVRTMTAKGTNVSSATSFVISMELKKLSSTNNIASVRSLPDRSQTSRARCSNRPACRRPATTVIRQ